MSTSVIIATSGRADTVSRLIPLLFTQSVPLHEVIISCVRDDDVGSLPRELPVKIVKGQPGLTRQRNEGLRNVSAQSEIAVFFDDDFIPDSRWVETTERYFADHPTVVGLTGTVIADGINGPGLSFEDAVRLLAVDSASPAMPDIYGFSPYGCNMAFRRDALKDLWFDERLVLYGWQEDRDFGARVGRRGDIVKIGGARGVHLGIKAGRVRGIRLGYSQIINPFYMRKKGTMSSMQLVRHVGGNLAANIVRSVRPEPYVDRLGRLRGNAIGLFDLLKGEMNPERAAGL